MEDIKTNDNKLLDGSPAVKETESPFQARLVGEFLQVNPSRIGFNPEQPRKYFDAEVIAELTESIRENGILQPLLVRKSSPQQLGESPYFLIAGERRLRAALALGLPSVPVNLIEADEQDDLKLGIIENVQRQDLSPLEEAKAYRSLMDLKSLTQAECAELVGKGRSHVAHLLRVLNLAPKIQKDLCLGLISMGHVKVLAGIDSSPEQLNLHQEIIHKGLSVRSAEKKARQLKKSNSRQGAVFSDKKQDPANFDLEYVAENLRQSLRTKVAIKGGVEKGVIEVTYFSVDELERLFSALSLSP